MYYEKKQSLQSTVFYHIPPWLYTAVHITELHCTCCNPWPPQSTCLLSYLRHGSWLHTPFMFWMEPFLDTLTDRQDILTLVLYLWPLTEALCCIAKHILVGRRVASQPKNSSHLQMFNSAQVVQFIWKQVFFVESRWIWKRFLIYLDLPCFGKCAN